MGSSRYTVITHSNSIAKALYACYAIDKVVVIDKLLVDVNNYQISHLGITPDYGPELVYCQDYLAAQEQLKAFYKKPKVVIAYEPRFDAISWAQQVGSLLGFSTTDQVYLALDKLVDTDFARALANPHALQGRFPYEWFFTRMFEGVCSANISAIFHDARLSDDIPVQNIYSLYLLHKLGKLADPSLEKRYTLIVRDTLTGQILGEQIGAPSNRSDGQCSPNAVSYASRDAALDALHQCENKPPREISSFNCADTLIYSQFPSTSHIFSRLLRDSLFSVGNIFNELYKLYAQGHATYPFGTVARDTNYINAMRPQMEKAQLHMHEISSAQKILYSVIGSLPIKVIPLSDSCDRTVLGYMEAFAIDAFRTSLSSNLSYHYFKIGDSYFGVKRYSFPNIHKAAESTLSYLYPTSLNPARFGVYLRTLSAPDRVPFHTLMGFTMRSPCWIKWFIALHYLIEKGLVTMDGENVCLTRKIYDKLETIDNYYGELFEDSRFLAFDNIFNNVGEFSKLVTYLLSKLPTPPGEDVQIAR